MKERPAINGSVAGSALGFVLIFVVAFESLEDTLPSFAGDTRNVITDAMRERAPAPR